MSKTNKLKQQRKSKLSPIFDQGSKFVTSNFVAFFLPSQECNITIIASKKIGNAVLRNHSKRRLREIVRLYLKDQPVQIILLARNNTSSSEYESLVKDCQTLIKKIKQLF